MRCVRVYKKITAEKCAAAASKNQQASTVVYSMELTKTKFDVDLDSFDKDIPWLYLIPIALRDHLYLTRYKAGNHQICRQDF